jgi:hypothetical protein
MGDITTYITTVTNILMFTYGILAIVTGLDKFSNIIVSWQKYLPPFFTNISPVEPRTFMRIVGIIEIIAGILVFVITPIGSLIVGSWLGLIGINLLLARQYDIAVRDAVMALGVFSLFILSHA